MSAGAITMMIISIVVVWGGLLLSIALFRRNSDDSE